MVVLMLIPAALFAKGKKDAEVVTLVQVSRPQEQDPDIMAARTAWLDAHPNVIFKWVPQGSPGTSADALIAAGDPPNVIVCTPGGLGKFMLPGFAMDLSDTIDVSDFSEGTLDLYTREGQVLGIPWMISLNAFNVNLDLAEAVGFEVPEGTNWSIAEFLEFCELIKQNGPKGSYGTAIWAGNSGSQYLNLQYLAGFGVEIFRDGDYTKSYVDCPETVEALKFIKMLVDKGYAPPEAAVLDDDEAITFWSSGNTGALWARAGGWLNMLTNAVEQGFCDEVFNSKFMTWPQAPGVSKVPLTFGGTAGMVILSGNDYIDSLAADFVNFMGTEYARIGPSGGHGYSARISVPNPTSGTVGPNGDVLFQEILEVWRANGLYDIGYTTIIQQAWMEEWLYQLQGVITGKITPENASKNLGKKMAELIAETQ